MALGRGKGTLPFQLAVQEETNPPKREVSSGQEALLTPSSDVQSCPPPNSPKQSPHPWLQEFPNPPKPRPPSILSPNPYQTSSFPPASPDSSHPHKAPSNLNQPKHTPRLPKQRHRPATQGGSSSPHRFLPTFSPGGLEGAEIRFSPARRIPTARVRQGAHSPTRRTQPAGGDPRQPEGVCYGPRGRGCRKSQLRLPGCQAGSPPPQPTRPIGPRTQPRPVGASRKPRPLRAPGTRAAPAPTPRAPEMLL